MLRPQDILLVCKLAIHDKKEWTYVVLSEQLGLSVGEIYNAVSRSRQAGLLQGALQIVPQRLFDFLIHGVPRIFFPQRGAVSKGYPTSIYAPRIREQFAMEVSTEIPVVWPHLRGDIKGESLQPLYASVPEATRLDPALYDIMALLDVIRIGKARERNTATKMLGKCLNILINPKENDSI